MKVRNALLHAGLGAAMVLLSGCGVGTGDTVLASGGLTGTGITQGTITSFGSIHVNGTRYVTDGATFERDGSVADITAFEVGEIVTLRWTLDDDGITRNASLVFYDTEIRGVVTGVPDLVNNTVEVLGQTVQVTGTTAFHGTSITGLADIAQGDYVELNAFQQSYDPAAPIPLRATEIEVITPAATVSNPVDVELKGVVDATGPGTVDIGAITVHWLAVPDGTPAVGDYIKVEGSYSNTTPNRIDDATVRDARRGIELDADEEDEAELEGVVTSLTSPDEFEVNGQPVVTAPDVTYEPAGLVLAVGGRVEVEGTINALGILVADSIEARDEGDIEIEANVENIDADNQSVTVLGIEVFTNDLTQFDDDSDLELQYFDFADIGIGDHLVIRALEDSITDQVRATRVERQNATSEIALEGTVESKTDPSTITILGVDIDVASPTITSRQDENDAELTSTAFYDAVTVDQTVVGVSGDAGGWTDLEIESP